MFLKQVFKCQQQLRWNLCIGLAKILALTLRHGGLGLTDLGETTKTEYKHSTQITDKLTAKIFTQKLDLDYNPSDQLHTTHTKYRLWQEKSTKCQNSCHELLKELTPQSQQLIKGAMEKRASSWLPALPIKAIGYALNKHKFTDAVCMRYGWKLKGIPTHCACGKINSVDHSLIYKLGDYTSMRHDSVRDSEAQIIREVCRDVQTELMLLPINENNYERKVNTADNASLDIYVRGLWNSCEKTYFDIRITHSTSQSYSGKSLAEIYQQHDKEKKDSTTKEWLILRSLYSSPLSLQQLEGWHQNAQSQQKKRQKK